MFINTESSILAFARTGVSLILIGLIAFASGSGCGGCPAPSPPGSISLAWSITDLAGQPTSCDQVNAQSVALQLRNRASGNVVAATFSCPSSPSTTQLPAGAYDILIELRAADGTRLATAPDADVTIVAGELTQLTPVTFAANAKGSLVISLATAATTNCQPTGTNGAGITGITITLVINGDGCAPVTFIRSLGTTQRGTYTVNCTSPVVTTCIEKDETLTTNLAAQGYTIHVRGKIGAVDCWRGDDILDVPPPGKPLTHTVGLARQNTPSC